MSDDSPLDPSSLLGDPTAQEQAAAYAAALRKQQYDAGLLHVFGNRGLSDLGSSIGGQAQNALADMRSRDQSQGSLLLKSMGLGRKKLVNLKNGSSVMVDPLSGETEELENGLGAAAPKVMNAGDHSTISVGPDGKVTKLVDAPPPRPRGGGGHGGGLGGDKLDKALRGLREDIDPSSGRGQGLFGQDQGIRTGAAKILALIKNPETGVENYNLTSKQIPEFVQAVGGMISNGSKPAMAQLNHLMPHTAKMSVAEALEYITGHPEEANAPEFVRQYADTARREDKLAAQRIREVQLRRLPMHQGVYATNPNELKAAARQYLPDLSDEDLDAAFRGAYQPHAASVGAPSGGLTPEQQKRLSELRAKRDAGALK